MDIAQRKSFENKCVCRWFNVWKSQEREMAATRNGFMSSLPRFPVIFKDPGLPGTHIAINCTIN